MSDIEQLISNVKISVEKDQAFKNNTTTGFNIFTILRDENEEVMLHSKFLFELLNPRGAHNKGQLYLSLFLDDLNKNNNISIPQFDYNSLDKSAVYRERQNIDLLIFLPDGYTIIIENKIYAGDQEAQLERYYSIVVNQYKRDSDKLFIIYLTLDGHKPTPFSIGNLNHTVCCISYASEIDDWLDQCILKTQDFNIKEVITQYKSLICKLSNKYGGDSIMDEVSNLIISDINTFNNANAIAKAMSTAKSKIIMSFMRAIEKEIINNGYMLEDFDDEGIKNYYISREYPCQTFLIKQFEENINFCFCIEIGDCLYSYFAFGRRENGIYKIIPKSDMENQHNDIFKKCLNAVTSIFGDIKRQTSSSIRWEYIYDPLFRKYDFKNFSENCIDLIQNTDHESLRICEDLLPLVNQLRDAL